jgi:hypothetical protein
VTTARVAGLVALVLITACESEREREFGPPRQRDDSTIVSGVWRLYSFEVDIELSIATTTSSTSCATSATLTVNTLTSATDRYNLNNAHCTILAFTAEGDLIVLDQPSGADWRELDLTVDTSKEEIALGPAEVDGTIYRLVLSAPPCEDHPVCDCGRLSRFEDDQETRLPLGRICD